MATFLQSGVKGKRTDRRALYLERSDDREKGQATARLATSRSTERPKLRLRIENRPRVRPANRALAPPGDTCCDCTVAVCMHVRARARARALQERAGVSTRVFLVAIAHRHANAENLQTTDSAGSSRAGVQAGECVGSLILCISGPMSHLHICQFCSSIFSTFSPS